MTLDFWYILYLILWLIINWFLNWIEKNFIHNFIYVFVVRTAFAVICMIWGLNSHNNFAVLMVRISYPYSNPHLLIYFSVLIFCFSPYFNSRRQDLETKNKSHYYFNFSNVGSQPKPVYIRAKAMTKTLALNSNARFWLIFPQQPN